MSKYAFFLVTLLWISCESNGDEKYFNGDITIVGNPPYAESINGALLELDDLYTGRMDVADSMLFFSQYNFPDYFISIFNYRTGSHLGYFIGKGNGPGEYNDMSWIHQFFMDDGHLKGLLYSSLKEEIIVWNITKSLYEQKTCVESAKFSWRRKYNKPYGYMFFTETSANDVVTFVPEYFTTKEGKMPPKYVYNKININSGKIEKSYPLFKVPVENNNKNFIYSDGDYFFSSNVKNSDGSKIAFGMAFLAQINILDLNDGKVTGYRLENSPDFNNLAHNNGEFTRYYVNITAHDKYIYALYSGEKMTEENRRAKAEEVHIFDWEGNFVKKLKLDHPATQISVTSYDGFTDIITKDDSDDIIFLYHIENF